MCPSKRREGSYLGVYPGLPSIYSTGTKIANLMPGNSRCFLYSSPRYARSRTEGSRSGGCRILVEVFLEARENVPDFLWSAQVSDGIGNGVVIFEQEQGTQLLPI